MPGKAKLTMVGPSIIIKIKELFGSVVLRGDLITARTNYVTFCLFNV